MVGVNLRLCRLSDEAGLHVICEKPLCFTAEEARELVDLSKNRTNRR
ncbi:hypothetical protein CKF46_36695, partial [Klebsiella pneumoniae]